MGFIRVDSFALLRLVWWRFGTYLLKYYPAYPEASITPRGDFSVGGGQHDSAFSFRSSPVFLGFSLFFASRFLSATRSFAASLNGSRFSLNHSRVTERSGFFSVVSRPQTNTIEARFEISYRRIGERKRRHRRIRHPNRQPTGEIGRGVNRVVRPAVPGDGHAKLTIA